MNAPRNAWREKLAALPSERCEEVKPVAKRLVMPRIAKLCASKPMPRPTFSGETLH